MKPGTEREEMFLADPGLHASYSDAWEKARYVQDGFLLPVHGSNGQDGTGAPGNRLCCCPKFDYVPAYLWKLTEIFRNNDTKQVTTSTWKCPAAQGSYTRIATHYFT